MALNASLVLDAQASAQWLFNEDFAEAGELTIFCASRVSCRFNFNNFVDAIIPNCVLTHLTLQAMNGWKRSQMGGSGPCAIA